MPQESLKQRQEVESEIADDLSPVSRAKYRLTQVLARLESAVESRLQDAITAEQSARAAAHEAAQAAARTSSEDVSAWEAKLAGAQENIAALAQENETLSAELAQQKSEHTALRETFRAVSKTLDVSIAKVEALLKE